MSSPAPPTSATRRSPVLASTDRGEAAIVESDGHEPCTGREASMALSVTTEERLASAVAYLREAGHEEEAQAVETLLAARSGRRRGSSPSPNVEPVSIGDAAEELGETPARVRQRIEL